MRVTSILSSGVLVCVVLLLTACFAPQIYIQPPKTYTLTALKEPQPVVVSLTYQIDGKRQPNKEPHLTQWFAANLEATGVFKVVDDFTTHKNTGEIKIVVNDVTSGVGGAFLVGLTWGIAGNKTTDDMQVNFSYENANGLPLVENYGDPVFSFQGNATVPAGLMSEPDGQHAVTQVLRDDINRFALQWEQANRLD